ncbi:hypothetical protein [Cupriavidus basilensis]|uniref:hypothetical protein n=1 Tax=Cupriavidus basilensis TaxID=68895 RepID=UPI0009E4A7C8|nr:hypothetical protein [Cupriavidus basilensis]
MPAILVDVQQVYTAPTKGRRYLTARGAARAEADAMLTRAYPSDQPEYDDMGRCLYGGFHWSSDERLVRVHKRLMRLLLRRLRNSHD